MSRRWQGAPTRARIHIALAMARRGIGPGRWFESRLAWIFGSPRSGSTWLLQTLGALPGVIPINEPLIGNYLAPVLGDYRGIRVEDLDASNFTFERQRRHVRDTFFSSASRDAWSPLLGKLIKTRFLATVAETNHDRALSRATVLIKEPSGSQAADLILGAVPSSRALFLLRDGRDVVDSELAAQAPGGWLSRDFAGIAPIEAEARLDFVVRSASKWLWRTEVVQEALRRHPGPTRTVRYEALRTEPLASFRDLCRWLGLDPPEEVLQRAVEEHTFERLPPEGRGPNEFLRSAQPGLWREHLSSDEQKAVEGVLAAKLRELGYET